MSRFFKPDYAQNYNSSSFLHICLVGGPNAHINMPFADGKRSRAFLSISVFSDRLPVTLRRILTPPASAQPVSAGPASLCTAPRDLTGEWKGGQPGGRAVGREGRRRWWWGGSGAGDGGVDVDVGGGGGGVAEAAWRTRVLHA